MIKKVLGGLVAALAFVAMFFKAKFDRAERKAETKRADDAERVVKDAKISNKIDTYVESAGSSSIDRLQQQFTKKR